MDPNAHNRCRDEGDRLTQKELAERERWAAEIASLSPKERARALVSRMAKMLDEDPDDEVHSRLHAEWLDWLHDWLLAGDAKSLDALFEVIDKPDMLTRVSSLLLLSMTRLDRDSFPRRAAFAERLRGWIIKHDQQTSEQAERVLKGLIR